MQKSIMVQILPKEENMVMKEMCEAYCQSLVLVPINWTVVLRSKSVLKCSDSIHAVILEDI